MTEIVIIEEPMIVEVVDDIVYVTATTQVNTGGGGGASSLIDLEDVTGTPGTGKAPVSDGAGGFPLTDIATQAELNTEASTRGAADTALAGSVSSEASTRAAADTALAAATAAHLADTSDAHDASAISVVDAGGFFTGTDVEAALQELGANGGSQPDLSDFVVTNDEEDTILDTDSMTLNELANFVATLFRRIEEGGGGGGGGGGGSAVPPEAWIAVNGAGGTTYPSGFGNFVYDTLRGGEGTGISWDVGTPDAIVCAPGWYVAYANNGFNEQDTDVDSIWGASFSPTPSWPAAIGYINNFTQTPYHKGGVWMNVVQPLFFLEEETELRVFLRVSGITTDPVDYSPEVFVARLSGLA